VAAFFLQQEQGFKVPEHAQFVVFLVAGTRLVDGYEGVVDVVGDDEARKGFEAYVRVGDVGDYKVEAGKGEVVVLGVVGAHVVADSVLDI